MGWVMGLLAGCGGAPMPRGTNDSGRARRPCGSRRFWLERKSKPGAWPCGQSHGRNRGGRAAFSPGPLRRMDTTGKRPRPVADRLPLPESLRAAGRTVTQLDDAALLQPFHLMWDNFPGMARLIGKRRVLLAANRIAEAKGFAPGAVCARVGAPEIHRGYGMAAAFREGRPQTDALLGDRLRGWLPVEGRPDLLPHVAIMLPDGKQPQEP